MLDVIQRLAVVNSSAVMIRYAGHTVPFVSEASVDCVMGRMTPAPAHALLTVSATVTHVTCMEQFWKDGVARRKSSASEVLGRQEAK